jgi:peptide/nickel transport system substrate-binding protein
VGKRTIACALVTIALAACVQNHKAAPDSNTTFSIAQQREPMSLNPALENGQSSTEWGFLLFSYLVKYDDRGRLIGDVATQAPTLRNGGISKDGLTVTYHLRPGVRFADGAPLTARDCVWSINAINNPANNVQSRYGYDRIAWAGAPNDTTLVLRLKEPFAPLLTLVLSPQGFPILPRHLLAKYPDFNHLPFGSKPVGSGPYVVDRWLRGDRVVMHANPYYFKGRPAIQRLTIRFVPDAQTAANLLQTREVQGYFNEQDFSQYPLLKRIAGYRVLETPVSGVGAIILNTQSRALKDAGIRHAVAEAIDIAAVVRKAYRGAVASAHPGRGLFFWAYDPRAYPDVPYNPADAHRRLAGRNLDLQLIIQAATPGDGIVANDIVQYERAAGVHVSIKQFNITQFVAPANEGGPVYGGKFDMALYPFVNGDDPDTTDQFACANVPPHGYNKSRICDARVDSLLAGGRSTFDTNKRKSIYSALEKLLYNRLPIALIYQRREIDAFVLGLRGESASTDGIFWNVGAWQADPQSIATKSIRPRYDNERRHSVAK